MTTDQGRQSTISEEEAAELVASFPLFESVPREEIAWLLARAELRDHAAGDFIRTPGVAIDEMSLPLTGRLGLYLQRSSGWRRVMETEAGYVLGAVPYSRMRVAPGRIVAETDMTLLSLHRKHFPDLIVECPAMTAALVHLMLNRAREFRTMELHDERLVALGKLASGLAHELNNPASGASSAARSLASLLDQAEMASKELAAARLSDAQIEAIDAVRGACLRPGSERSALERADREDDFAEWFERRGIAATGAEALASTDVSPAALDALANALPREWLGVAVRWIASGISAREAAGQIGGATARIHDLIAAVKGFTFMDRAGSLEEVDVAQGIADTIAMLESKANTKSVHLRSETADDLRSVWGYGGEINQVLQAVIDNAIDAVGTEGSVTVTASMRNDSIVVRVADNGPGIAEENQPRVFDPFYTTKPVGSGTGLGLYQARRIVHLHRGDIDFTSQPGRTVFRVRLPVIGAMVAGAKPVREGE